MSMSEYRLARELGNPLARGFQIYKTTQLWHSLVPMKRSGATAGEEEEVPSVFAQDYHRAGVNALDIERQQGR